MTVRIVEYSIAWPEEFAALSSRLGEALGSLALRIDHIGSTAVPGLAGKDVIDVQITMVSLAPGEELAATCERVGLVLRTDIVRDHRPPGADGPDEDWEKRYADAPDGERAVHVHFRVSGRPNQRYALLFRDYLRAHPRAATAYERAKRELARLCPDSATYAEAKDPICDLIMSGAEA